LIVTYCNSGGGAIPSLKVYSPLHFNTMDPFEIKDKYQLLPLTQIISPRSSIDERFKEAFIAAISDVNMLKPKKINKLLKDTHAALMEDVKIEKNEDAKEAINSLISLLEENSALQSVVEHYMNRIRKA
jgi:hypothetical protein